MSFRNDDKEELTRLLAKVDVEVGDSKDVVNDYDDTPAKQQPPPASRRTQWSFLGLLLVYFLSASLVLYPWLLYRKEKQSTEDTSAAHLEWPLIWDDGHHHEHEHGHHRHPRILNGKPAEHIFL